MTKTKSAVAQNTDATKKAAMMLQLLLQQEEYGKFNEEENPTVQSSTEAKTIIIPISMSKLEAARELERQHDAEEQVIDVDVSLDGWNWKDALVAVKLVSEKLFGWINGKRTWRGNPTEIDVVTGFLSNGKPEIMKAFYGDFRIATFEDASCSISVRYGVVSISVTCKKKYSNRVTEYYNAIREHLSEFSIFRGKAIVVTNNGEGEPEFELIKNKVNDKIVLNHKERNQVDNFVLGRLHKPAKRCYLFMGDYGNGKTETAMIVGKKATDLGQSFFYLKDAVMFEKVLKNVKQYQPCVLFVEDVDEIASGEQRDEHMNKILNTLDGVETKGNNLTVIFTTNHEDRINPALRRPGRIDLMIRFTNPSKESVKLIYEAYFENVKGGSELNYDYLVEQTPDVQAAVIAEICKRAVDLTDDGIINTAKVEAAIISMETQIMLMKKATEKIPTNDETVVKNFLGLVARSV